MGLMVACVEDESRSHFIF